MSERFGTPDEVQEKIIKGANQQQGRSAKAKGVIDPAYLQKDWGDTVTRADIPLVGFTTTSVTGPAPATQYFSATELVGKTH